MLQEHKMDISQTKKSDSHMLAPRYETCCQICYTEHSQTAFPYIGFK